MNFKYVGKSYARQSNACSNPECLQVNFLGKMLALFSLSIL